MKLKTIISISFLLLFISCNSYKFIYFPVTEYENIDKLNRINAEYIKFDELYLTFTKTFTNDKIRLYENDTLKFNSFITTGSTNVQGIAKAFKINKKSNLKIYFDSNKKPLYIDGMQMKEYKFIYISKKDNKILIEFNNSTKKFD